jgi:hypothetical protein
MLMLAKIKAALAWFRGLFTKGKTEMTDVVAATEAAVESAPSTVETDVKAVLEPAVSQVVAAAPAVAAAVIVDVEAAAAKLKDIFDKLGVALPAQWAQVVALAKVL